MPYLAGEKGRIVISGTPGIAPLDSPQWTVHVARRSPGASPVRIRFTPGCGRRARRRRVEVEGSVPGGSEARSHLRAPPGVRRRAGVPRLLQYGWPDSTPRALLLDECQ